MEIQCQCGQFRAELKAFPKDTPGRCVCYCNDCQTYLNYLQRGDLLDENGGTEIIPAYPANVRILNGQEHLKCVRLSPKGMFRFSTTCCNTPIGNTQTNMGWLGLFRCVYNNAKDSNSIDQLLGPVRSRVLGEFAKGVPPKGTAKRFDAKAFFFVVPYILKGKIFKKTRPSPFFNADGKTPIVTPYVLSKEERSAARK